MSSREVIDAPEARARIRHVYRDLLQHGKLQRRVTTAAAAVAAHAVRAHRDAFRASHTIPPRILHDFHRIGTLQGNEFMLHGLHSTHVRATAALLRRGGRVSSGDEQGGGRERRELAQA